jgi:phosphohistidine swiveling domain-containing protein
MELLTETQILDFRIRGNYFNQHTLLSRRQRGSEVNGFNRSGYSPPVVEFELQDGTKSSAPVREIDIPLLCQHDFEKAIAHLRLILNAHRGNVQAVNELHSAEPVGAVNGAGLFESAESRFVVPSTSSETHSEREISQKGFVLLKLSQQGYPVPDFVVMTAEAYNDRAHLEDHLAEAIEQLETLTRQKLGASNAPLLFAMRCATAQYIPGIMTTFLNVGVTETTLPCLEKMYGPIAARKIFLNNLRNLYSSLEHEDHAAITSTVRWDLPAEEVMRWIERLSEIVRKHDRKLIEDAFYQAAFFVKQSYKHFEENQELIVTLCRGTEHHPCLILQKMVCTVRDDQAYAGVLSSRHTQTGLGVELQTAHNIFGEEMMTGTAEIQSTAFEDRQNIKHSFPAVYHFVPHLVELEKEFESPVTIEFAVEATNRYQWFALLQLNETGMSGRAALTSVVDLHKSGAVSKRRVTELIRPYHIKQLTSDTIDQEVFNTLDTFCSGVAVLPRSAVSARVYFAGDAALGAKTQGEKVCLCKKTFVPTDTVVMREVDAIISLTSAAIHVVTICQSLGIPALLNLEKNGVSLLPDGRLVNASGRQIMEGDWITISSRRRAIYEGKAKFTPARLLRYMKGETVEMDEEERKAFASIAYAYRYYQQLVRGLTVEQISTLSEVTRLVNFELRGESDEAKELVNGWFDDRETLYTEEVLKSDIGDHLGQSNVFDMLTLDRKIRFFKRALAKCSRERISGYEAGAFMLGRFLSQRYPAAFWKRFSPSEIALLVNEWVLFEKYMQLLHNVGERKVLQARKKILKEGLDKLYIHPGYVQSLITLKLSGAHLEEVKNSLPEWSDPQSALVLELLQQPYRVFYNFNAEWSVGELKKICRAENLPVPGPDDT